MIEEGAQQAFEAIGKEGCLFLSLVSIAEEYLKHSIDAYTAYKDLVERDLMTRDCYCKNQSAMLEAMTGKPWVREVRAAVPERVPDSMYTVLKYVNGGIIHFRRRGFDVYHNSNTVARGRLSACYCYTVQE